MLVLPISPMFPEFLARLHTTLLVLFCSSIHFIPFYIFSNWFTSRLWVLYDIVSSFMIRSSFKGNNCKSEMCALFVCNCIYSLFQVPRFNMFSNKHQLLQTNIPRAVHCIAHVPQRNNNKITINTSYYTTMYTQTCMRERLICIALYGTLNYLHSLLFISGTSIAKAINSHCQYTLKKKTNCCIFISL